MKDQHVVMRWDSFPAHEGRFTRTALVALLAPGWGSTVFQNANDPALAAPSFVLMGLAVAALGYALISQANRRSPRGVDRWSRTDTGIVVVLVGFAVLLAAATVWGPSGNLRSAAASFCALYLLLAAYFGATRRGTVVRT